jgi:hypothetical protein
LLSLAESARRVVQQHDRGMQRRRRRLEEIADDLSLAVGILKIDGLGLAARGSGGE